MENGLIEYGIMKYRKKLKHIFVKRQVWLKTNKKTSLKNEH